MKRISLLVICVIAALAADQRAFPGNSAFNGAAVFGASQRMRKNLKFDFGAVGDGVTDDSPAFNAFQSWGAAQTGPVELEIPPGTYHITKGSNVINWYWTRNVKQLVVWAYGATVDGIYIGGGGTRNGSNYFSFINDVTAGSTTITCSNVADATNNMSVGDWLCISNIDLQGAGSYPQNWQNFEYQQITAIDTVGGVVTLGTPLRNNYYAHYPHWGLTTSTEQGGPALAATMANGIRNWNSGINFNWDIDQTIYGLTIQNSGTNNQTNMAGKKIQWIDCSWPAGFNSNAPTASQSLYVRYKGCKMPGFQVEIDKLVTNLEFDDCDIATLLFQSSPIKNCVIRNCRINNLNGTPEHATVTDCAINSLQIGPTTYGHANSLTLNNCHVVKLLAVDLTGVTLSPSLLSNGVFTIPLPTSQVDFTNKMAAFQAGGRCFLTTPSTFNGLPQSGAVNNNGTPFVVTDITADATNVYVHTTIPNGMSPPGGAANFGIAHVPVGSLTARGCWGDPNVVNWCHQSPARPAFEYFGFAGQINKNSTINQGLFCLLWGTFTKLRVNVIKAYTGAQGTLKLHALANAGGAMVASDGTTLSNWDPQINLKIAGERVITPSGNTGAQTGDANLTPSGVWMNGRLLPTMTVTDISAEAESVWPVVDIEATTDQGILAREVIQGAAFNYRGQ